MVRIFFVTAFVSAFTAGSVAFATDRDTEAQFFPDSTVLYLQVPDPSGVISLVFDHPLREKIEALEPYRIATNSDQYRKFLLGRTVVEAQVQMPWREALETFLAHGVSVAIDGRTQGIVMVVHGKDQESMRLLGEKLIEFAKLGPNRDQIKQAEYRGISAYQVDKIGFAVHQDRLVVTNQMDLGKQVLDRMLDGGESLAVNPRFVAANERRDSVLTAWAFVDVEAIREAGVANHIFRDQINNPVGELLLGGIQSSLQRTPFATASLNATTERLELRVGMPHQAEWVSESREYFFGPTGSGRAPQIPSLPETLFALSTYRDFSEVWLRAGDLFNSEINDSLAQADANLTTLFAGRDFGEDILGAFQPEVGFVAVRQEFVDTEPTPAIRLPAFAAIFELREPELMTGQLRRTFQSLVGFLNVVGAMNGQHQLELGMEQVGDAGELVTATYVPEDQATDADNEAIVFNFSPSIGFAGNRCIVASSKQLARTLAELGGADGQTIEDNTRASLNGAVLRDVLTDNRAQLIAQNMLEEGSSREDAEATIDLLLHVLGYIQGASATLGTSADLLQLKVSMELDR